MVTVDVTRPGAPTPVVLDAPGIVALTYARPPRLDLRSHVRFNARRLTSRCCVDTPYSLNSFSNASLPPKRRMAGVLTPDCVGVKMENPMLAAVVLASVLGDPNEPVYAPPSADSTAFHSMPRSSDSLRVTL